MLVPPARGAGPVSPGWWQLLSSRWARCPKTLVWDGEGAVGRWRARRAELTEDCQAFRGVLGAKVLICKPATPRPRAWSSGSTTTWRRSFLPGRTFTVARPTSTPSWPGWPSGPTAGACGSLGCAPGRPGRRRPGGDAGAAAGRRRRSGGAARVGCRATTTSAWTPTTTRCTRPRSAAGSRCTPTWTGSWVTCEGKVVADHARCWARHQTITDPEHTAAAKRLRHGRALLRPAADRR